MFWLSPWECWRKGDAHVVTPASIRISKLAHALTNTPCMFYVEQADPRGAGDSEARGGAPHRAL